jgi:hypothetical protein
MSYTIRSFIRGILLENAMQEAVPSAPPEDDLNEAPPPAPDEDESGGVPMKSSASGQLPATAAPVDQALNEYMNDAIQFILDNDIGIGAAADYFMEGITGSISPDEIMTIYEGAKNVDIRHGHHDPQGNDKNWTVLLLGLALSGLSGEAIINYMPQIMKAAQELLIRANNAVQPMSLQERSGPHSNKKILSEGVTIGRTISKAVKKLSDDLSVGRTLDIALEAEAQAAARLAAKDVKDLEKIILGLPHEKFDNETLSDYVREKAKEAIKNTSLSTVNAPWAQSAQAELRSFRISDPKISDLLNPPPGAAISSAADAQRDNLVTQLAGIDAIDDDFFEAAVNNDVLRKAVKMKTKDSRAGAGSSILKYGTVAAGTAAKAIVGVLTGLAGTAGGLFYIASEYLDDVSAVSVDPLTLRALSDLKAGTGRSGNEKIVSLDIYLRIAWNSTNSFSTIRQKLSIACEEYWVTEFLDKAACAEFIKILQKGPYGI